MKRLFSVFILFITAVVFILPQGAFAANALPAFPGAEGGGKYATGARGVSAPTVYHVTNLNSSGTGSFADAVSKPGRIIVFDVGGTINLNRTFSISKDNLTILGQTAPGDGITLTGGGLSFENRNNLIIRYLRVRPTDVNGGEPDGIGGRWTNNVILDHCSTSWSIDEGLTLYAGSSESKTQGAHNTVQYCISSESLRMSNHFKGAHGYGAIFGANYSSWHHNLLAHHDSRSPRLDRELNGTDVRNNVIYDWGQTNSAYGGEPYSYNYVTKVPSNINWVNNYYKYGPGTASNLRYRIIQPSAPKNSGDPKSNYYINGNYVTGSQSVTDNNINGVYQAENANMLDAPVSMVDSSTNIDYNLSETQTAEEAYNDVLQNVGATLPRRDAVDARIIADVKNGTGRIINSADEVGGATTASAPSSRVFEIPQSWKNENSMGSAKETDIVPSGEWAGYTWIEAYVNDWTEQQETPTNPDITVISPAIQSLDTTVNGHIVNNDNWAVIYDDEPLSYKAVSEPKSGTAVTKVEIYDGAKKIKTVTGANVDEPLDLAAGTHYITSKAYNDLGEATQSPTSIVYVKSRNTAGQFSHAQIGTTAFDGKGGSWLSGGTYTIMGSGKLVKSGSESNTAGVSSDKCDFMYKEVTGDFDISVRVEQIPKFENGAVAGLMMRETLGADSRMVMLADGWLKYGENVRAIVRSSAGSSSKISWLSGIANNSDYTTEKYPMPKYMRMQRSGDTITLSVSNSGTNWTDNARKPISFTISGLPDTVYLGIAVDSIEGGPRKNYMSEAKFLDLKLTAAAEPTTEPGIATPAPTDAPQRYEVSISDSIKDGNIEISGVSSGTAEWSAEEHSAEISKGEHYINGTDASDGTLAFFDDNMSINAITGFPGVARGAANPSITVPVTDESIISGTVYRVTPTENGTITLNLYIYTGKQLNVYDNTSQEYLVKSQTYGGEDVYAVTLDNCVAGHDYYIWAAGSKIGVKSITVPGGSGMYFAEGETVLVTVTPNAGFRTEYVYTEPECSVSKLSDTEYVFVMPAKKVTVGAEFVSASEPKPTSTPEPTATPKPTLTPEPTATPNPTSTPEPTATPKPTLTPEPTASSNMEPTETPTAVPTSSPKGIFYEEEPVLDGNTVRYKVVNNSGGKAYFAVAAYSGDFMTLCDVRLIEAEPYSVAYVPIELNIDTGSKVRAMLWDAKMSPVCNAIVLN